MLKKSELCMTLKKELHYEYMLRVKELSWPIYERFLNAQEHTVGKIIMDKSKLVPPRIQLSTERVAESLT